MNQAEVSNIRQRRLAGHVTPPTLLEDWGIHPALRLVWKKCGVATRGKKKSVTYKKLSLILSPAVDGIIVISFLQLFDLHPVDVRHWIHLSCWIIKGNVFSPFFPTLSFPSLFILSGRGSTADSPSHAELLYVITTRLPLCKHNYFLSPPPSGYLVKQRQG